MRYSYALLTALMLAACGGDDSETHNVDRLPDMGATEDLGEDDTGVTDLGMSDMGEDQPDMLAVDADVVEFGWQTLDPIATGARQETAVVALDQKIYVIGGFNQAISMVSNVEIYDPSTGDWSSAADLPVPMHHANAAVVNGQIWVVGFLVQGFAADGRTFVYDPNADTWTPGADMPEAERRGSSAVGVIGEDIYVAGGLRSGAVRDFSVLDTTTGTWTGLPDVPRDVDHAAFGVIDAKLVIAGGRDSNISAHTTQVDIFDPQSSTWTQGAAMPTSRGGVAAAVLDGRLFVFGGEGAANESGVFDQVEAYDLDADSWQTFDPMPQPRHGMGAATVGDTIFVPGGADREAFAPLEVHTAFRPPL